MLSNMLNNIIDMAYYFCANHYDIIVAIAIMVSAIIVFIGFLKAVWFDRIRNKEIRRAVLALANIVCCFAAAFGYFLKNGWDFKYYPIAGVALTLTSIITYYIYETVPGARRFIGGIGRSAIGKVFNVSLLAVTTDDTEAIKSECEKGVNEVKVLAQQELKNAVKNVKTDKDLIGL